MKKAIVFAAFVMLMLVCDARAVAPLSQYGQIQNVQTYSTNPFYKQGIYNPKAPQAVYATGADLNTGDCQRTVDNLIASECASRNNCRGLRVSDIRPNIMVKLSQLPGHNYATSCAGYIDNAFNTYTAKYGVNTNVNPTFPTPSSAKLDVGFKIENPYKQQPTAAEQRAAELQELQRQNQTTPHAVVGGDFPKTLADVSFSDRIALNKEGYEPYKDKSAFRSIKVEEDETFLARLCKVNPDDARCPKTVTPTTPGGGGGGGGDDGNGGGGSDDCERGSTPDCPIILTLGGAE